MVTKVVGVTFSNEDGSSRTRIIASMSESDQICLERDPFNQFDSNAVKVCVVKNGENKQIGFLAKDIASEVSPKLRRGVKFTTSIVGCGMWNDRPFCEIEINEQSSDTSSTTNRPVAPKPGAPSAPKPVASFTQNAPINPIQKKYVQQPSRPSISTPKSNSYNSSSNNSGCFGVIVIAVIVASAIALFV